MPGLTLVVDIQNRKLVRGFSSAIEASLPALFQGDTIDPLNIRFVSPTGIASSPFADVDYSTAFVQAGIGVIGAKPTGGTFTLTDSGAGQTTAAIPHDATAAAVQSAIQTALTTNWGAATVSGSDGGPWIITNGSNGAQSLLSAGAGFLTPVSTVDISTVQDGGVNKPEIQYVLLSQAPIAYQDAFSPTDAPAVEVEEIEDGGIGQNEIQLITLAGDPYSGAFVLNFGNGVNTESTTPIAFNATALEVQAALEVVSLIGAGNVSVSGNDGGPWTVVFMGDLAEISLPLMTASSSLVGPLMMTGSLGLNTGSIDEEIGESPSIQRTFSVKVTPLGGLPATVLQIPCSIFNDLIRGAITIPTPGPSYLTAAEVYALIADFTNGPASSTNSNLAAFDGADGKLLKDSGVTPSTDGTMAANSNLKLPTEAAIVAYVSMKVAGLLRLAGSTDCSGDPDYPAAVKGDAYFVSVAGKIGGAAGILVDVGDVYFALEDNAGGDQATVGADWSVLNYNLVQATESIIGIMAIATSVETLAGSNDSKAITPLKLKAFFDSLDLNARAVLSMDNKTAAHTFTYDSDIAASDHNPAKSLNLTGSTGYTFTLDTNANQAFPAGAQFTGMQLGTGKLTITAASGVTINGVNAASWEVAYQYGSYYLRQISTDAWVIGGDVIPA